MKFYLSSSDQPYYNIALEEYLLLHSEEDILLCYVNRSSLVVGRFQVPYREIDAAYLHQNGMDLVRRLSGGGSVYHDGGNLNYSYISNHDDKKENAYDKFNSITVGVLQSLGLVQLSFERNNIFCQGKKISGVAQYKRKKRMVHHGTLLVEADLRILRRLFMSKDYYDTKAIASVSSHVANANEFVEIGISAVLEAFSTLCDGILQMDFDEKLIHEKTSEYQSTDWVVGKSPNYQINKDGVDLSVEKGRVVASESHPQLVGAFHHYEKLAEMTDNPEIFF